ncbi:peptidoglycan DD-metalloendopeptidase family protein [Oscillibacter sp.]|uniref:peptidoglycan DD-metalloendopeptidase family protein n=1 Tax=Oscillibacter sp. TaxID=1945593 RepID=UPI001B7C1781|nr:peptidoglycan DD-metalloendopeptidase family protein [Oscillibacter sp.]MBP3510136.1 peptidoglycan DD-metalloendopeptidase family protein [Oscillibacter sp.]
MDNKKWEALRGSAGFYITLAVCLLVVGLSGWMLLSDRGKEPAIVEEDLVPEVSAPAPEVTEEEPEQAVVETIQPQPVEEETPPMPEVEVDDTPVVVQAPRLVVSPLNGQVLTAFSVDKLVYDVTMDDWRVHDGVDISAKPGTTVLAACSGTVLAVEDDPMMGITVTIGHDGGYQTTYASLQSRPTVEAGDTVSAGQIIGAVGTTAKAESGQSPHLHFSVTKDGDAVDPEEFLKR